MKFTDFPLVAIYQITLSREERDRLNGPNGGWDSEPKFSRYADVTCGHSSDDWLDRVREAIFAGDYAEAGTVRVNPGTDSDMCESAFVNSQSINAPWTANPDCVSFTGRVARSTSVGDLVRVPNGRLFAVAPIGFVPVFGD